MNNLVDPITLLLIGGCAVGKTTFLRRLAGLEYCQLFQPTSGFNVGEFRVELKHNAHIIINIIDISSELLTKRMESIMPKFFAANLDAIIIVADSGNSQSFLDVNQWLELISRNMKRNIIKHLVVNKADIPISQRKFTPDKLSFLIKNSSLSGWSWTVGNPDFGDIDVSRGSYEHQKPPEDVLYSLILSILSNRQGNFCQLLTVPFKIDFLQLKHYDNNEIETYFRNFMS